MAKKNTTGEPKPEPKVPELSLDSVLPNGTGTEPVVPAKPDETTPTTETTETAAPAANVVPLYTNGQIPPDVLALMEKRDEQAIEQELVTGMTPESLCYAYRSKQWDQKTQKKVEVGPIVCDLSIAGYAACRQRFRGIQFPIDKMQVDRSSMDGMITIFVEGIDTRNNATSIGAGTANVQAKSSGKLFADPHAPQKALSKAQRNATRPLIPLSMILRMKKAYLLKLAGTKRQWETWMYPEYVRQDVRERRIELEWEQKEGGQTTTTTTTTTTRRKKSSAKQLDKPCSEGQRRRIFALLGGLPEAGPDELREFLLLAYDLKGTMELKVRQYHDLVSLFEKGSFLQQLDRYRERDAEASMRKADEKAKNEKKAS